LPGRKARDKATTGKRRVYRRNQVGGHGQFDDVAESSRSLTSLEDIDVLVSRKKYDLGAAASPGQLLGYFNSAHYRHRYV